MLTAKLHDWRTSALLLVFAAAPCAAFLLGVTKPLNIAMLALMALLFAGCVILIPAAQLPAYYGLIVWVFLFGFLLNVLYELIQSPLYTHFAEPGYTYPELVAMLLGASAADGFIGLNVLFALTVFQRGRRTPLRAWRWQDVAFVIALALAGQIVGETVALRTGEWGYTAAMPRLPVLGVGLTPLLQIPLLILPVFWLAHRVRGGFSE